MIQAIDKFALLHCCFLVSGVLVSQYLQNVTKRLDMGAEYLYQFGSNIPGNQIGIFTLAGRYACKYFLSALYFNIKALKYFYLKYGD